MTNDPDLGLNDIPFKTWLIVVPLTTKNPAQRDVLPEGLKSLMIRAGFIFGGI
ncbi:MAG: hypothetical protein KDD53_08070 [Bdellovibrionales bacterium]|nr:hypothetical protein [Bdellovibrionales bacterium]